MYLGTKCDAVYVCICQQVDCRRTTFYGEHHAIACRVCEKNGLFQLVSCISRWFGNISSWGVLAKSRYCPRTGGPCGTVAAELDAQLKKFAISHIENKHWSICNLRSPGSLRNVPDSHVNSQPATLMAGGSRICLSFLRNCFNHEKKRGQRHRFSKVRIHQSTL